MCEIEVILKFEPINEHHAISKVVFVLHISPSITIDEINEVKNAHEFWRDLLPAINEPKVISIAIDSEFEQPPPVPPPVFFTRYRSDGNFELRLVVEHDNIIVECWQYSSWQLVWKRSRELLTKVADVLKDQTRQIRACSLQYTDEFIWTSKEQVDFRELLDSNSEFIPPKIFDYGISWHLHQGWFHEKKMPIPGKTLERMHVSSRPFDERCIVQFENLIRYDPQNPNILLSTAFDSESDDINKVFEELHKINKYLLKEFLHNQMSERIGLI